MHTHTHLHTPYTHTHTLHTHPTHTHMHTHTHTHTHTYTHTHYTHTHTLHTHTHTPYTHTPYTHTHTQWSNRWAGADILHTALKEAAISSLSLYKMHLVIGSKNTRRGHKLVSWQQVPLHPLHLEENFGHESWQSYISGGGMIHLPNHWAENCCLDSCHHLVEKVSMA